MVIPLHILTHKTQGIPHLYLCQHFFSPGFLFVWEQGLILSARVALNLQSSCLFLHRAGTTGADHHAQLCFRSGFVCLLVATLGSVSVCFTVVFLFSSGAFSFTKGQNIGINSFLDSQSMMPSFLPPSLLSISLILFLFFSSFSPFSDGD